MSFSELTKLKALAIVHIFETSKPLGDYTAVAVLDDGAGISYGINQFTHKSGSLAAVISRYGKLKGSYPANVAAALPDFRLAKNIGIRSNDLQLKRVLADLGKDPLMQQAQREIAFEKYMQPAIEACEGSDFVLPLSLAVIYDSINHGSFAMIRDRVVINPPGNGSMKPVEFEKLWISTYVRKRDAWLESIPRLAKTDYRTDFFLAQIGRGNWDLNLPMNVHGFNLTAAHFPKVSTNQFADLSNDEIDRAATAEPQQLPPAIQPEPAEKDEQETVAVIPAAEAPTQQAENIVNVGTDAPPPANFVPEEKEADAPEPTGFMGKLKAQGAALLAIFGGGAGIKEIFGIQISAETVQLLKVLVPTVLGLGFLGFLVWYVSEKIVGFKTLKLQSEINTDPNRHNLKINPK